MRRTDARQAVRLACRRMPAWRAPVVNAPQFRLSRYARRIGPSASAVREQRVGVLADPGEPVQVALVARALLRRAGAGLLAAVGDALGAARVVGADVEQAVEAAERGREVRAGLREVWAAAPPRSRWNGCAARANGRIWFFRIGARLLARTAAPPCSRRRACGTAGRSASKRRPHLLRRACRPCRAWTRSGSACRAASTRAPRCSGPRRRTRRASAFEARTSARDVLVALAELGHQRGRSG